MQVPSDGKQIKTRSRRDEGRIQAILDATIELLAEVGFDRMTMDTIASRAQASKATIYRHWADKTELVLDALRSHGSIVPDVPDSGTLRGDLEAYARGAAAATAGIDGSLVVGLLAVAARDPELAALLSLQVHDAQIPMLTELVDRARGRSEVGSDIDATVISEVLPGALIMHLIVLGLPDDEVFIRRLVDHVLIPLLGAR
jgi:AcrR family transcriptional regulator